METEVISDQGVNDTDFFIFDVHNLTDGGDTNEHAPFPKTRFEDEIRAVSDFAMTYFAPFAVAVGLAGNLLSFLLLVLTKLRRLSRGVYLIAICVSDQSFLILLTVGTHSMGAVDLYNDVDALCKILIYTAHFLEVGKFFAVLLVMDTFITLRHPRLATKMCRVWSSARMVGVTTLLVATYSVHAFTQISTSAPGNGYGRAYCRYHDYSQTVRFHIADIVLLSVIPTAFLVILSVALCFPVRRKVRYVSGAQPSLQHAGDDESPNTTESQSDSTSTMSTIHEDEVATLQRTSSSSKALPLAVLALHVALLPAMAIQCMGIYDYMNPGSLHHIYMYYFYIQQLIHVFSYLYFCVKFFLCVAFWELYRRTLISCIKNLWHQRTRLYGKVPYRAYNEEVGMSTVN